MCTYTCYAHPHRHVRSCLHACPQTYFVQSVHISNVSYTYPTTCHTCAKRYTLMRPGFLLFSPCHFNIFPHKNVMFNKKNAPILSNTFWEVVGGTLCFEQQFALWTEKRSGESGETSSICSVVGPQRLRSRYCCYSRRNQPSELT